MKKSILAVGLLACFILSVLMVSGVFAAKDVVELNASQGKVTFTHKKHAEALKIDCIKCHHTWKAGETSGKLCDECHKAKAEGKAVAAKDAFHKDCKGCHDEKKKEGNKSAPTLCTQCHVKAK